jgi:hypothetical protein
MPISLEDFDVLSTAAKNAVSRSLPPTALFVLITVMEGTPMFIHSNTSNLDDAASLLRLALQSAQSGDMSRIDQ